MEYPIRMSEKQVFCQGCGESVIIYIWPGNGSITFKNNGFAKIRELEDGAQSIDFYCCLDCANKKEFID
jgi:hypothetical protein